LGFWSCCSITRFSFMIWLTKCKGTIQAALESYMCKQCGNQTTDSHGTWHPVAVLKVLHVTSKASCLHHALLVTMSSFLGHITCIVIILLQELKNELK
jgi:hypothetical protein